ncbi:hypothetical protein WJX73_006977 [Symbiochloris irregularis]|uniref:GLTSCR protein conserved domain-containing protein n=1 Tax=Symbiochloris irregularis TaxID=706552 RepID=A0AAW1NM86_9CHLO
MLSRAAPSPTVSSEAAAKQVALQNASYRQLELLQDDARRIRNPDTTRPFTSLQDAVDRLLPYHLFAEPFPGENAADKAIKSEDGAAVQAAEPTPSQLHQSAQQSKDLALKIQQLQDQVAQTLEKLPNADSAPPTQQLYTAEEGYLLEKAVHDAEKAACLNLRKEIQMYRHNQILLPHHHHKRAFL